MVWRITIRVGNRKGAALNCCALLSVVHRCSKRQRTVGSAANPAADIYEFRIENMENREFASLAVWIECTGRICSETGATRARDGGDCDRDRARLRGAAVHDQATLGAGAGAGVTSYRQTRSGAPERRLS